MPDANLAAGYIKAAKRLIPTRSKKIPQGQLRCAISTSYYAVYHALARVAADCLIGATKSKRPNKAWVEVYRGLGHGLCKAACESSRSIQFPQEIHDFAEAFIQLQNARHNADYNPMVRPTKEEALFFVALAERSIESLKNVSANDRKAFSAWVLITSPGATQARKWIKSGDTRTLKI